MFFEPSPSKFDLNFRIGRVPVRIHPLFWVAVSVFGATTFQSNELFIWIVAGFVSILIHELGHSLAMRSYGYDSRIVLYLFGGLTLGNSLPTDELPQLSTKNQMVISLAGPFFGLLFTMLSLAAFLVLVVLTRVNAQLGFIELLGDFTLGVDTTLFVIFVIIVMVNFIWSIVNLMPVYPLDGGQIARTFFVNRDPAGGLNRSLKLSAFAGVFVALGCMVIFQSVFLALIVLVMAVRSYLVLNKI